MITLQTPIVEPAKTADGVWILSLQIIAPNPASKVTVNVVLAPYVSQTGEVLKSRVQSLPITDLYAEAANNSTLTDAITAITTAVESYIASKNITF